MKYIIISLLLFFTVNAQTIWYVDRDATGSANGTSWANAWRTISSSNQTSGGVNYASLSPGDTIYVSGGSDSTLYRDPPDITAHRIYPSGGGITYASGNPVVIAPAWQSGHNGEVYIGAKNNNTDWILEIHNISNIKLTGFNFIDNRTANYGTMLYLGGDGVDGLSIQDSLITIDNCHIVGNALASLVYLSGYKITIKNCLIEQPENDLLNDQDPIGMSGGKGGHTIDGCTIIMRNGNEFTDAHRDGIQISNVGYNVPAGVRPQITISNTLIIDTNPNGVSWNNMVYAYIWSGLSDCRLLFYNNIFVNRKINSTVGGLGLGRYYESFPYPEHNSIFFLNNTIISKGTNGGMFTAWAVDTLVMKNNLFIKDSTSSNILNIENGVALWNAVVKDIDYNHYARYGGTSGVFAVVGDNKTWGEWQADGFDTHSSSGNSTTVTFDNKYGLDKSDYYTTTGRDLGFDLSNEYPFLQYDILGNPRTGAWDMGSLEYQDGAVDTVPSFSFTALNNQEINTAYIGSATFSGADSTFTVYTTTGARFNINSSGSLSTTPKTAVNGDVVYVETVTGSSYSTGYSETIVAGGVSQSFTVTTKAEPIVSSGNGGVVRGSDDKIWKDSTGKVVKTQ